MAKEELQERGIMFSIKLDPRDFDKVDPDKLLSRYDLVIAPEEQEMMHDWQGDGSRNHCWVIHMYARQGTNKIKGNKSGLMGMYYLSGKGEFVNSIGHLYKTFDTYIEAWNYLKYIGEITVRAFAFRAEEIVP